MIYVVLVFTVLNEKRRGNHISFSKFIPESFAEKLRKENYVFNIERQKMKTMKLKIEVSEQEKKIFFEVTEIAPHATNRK